MTNNPSTPWQPAKPENLSQQFSRLGWIGFWLQLALLAIPILLLVYVLFLRRPESPQQIGIDLSNYLSYGSLLVMVFTTFWFFRYTRVGKRLADPERRPPRASVERTLWVGLWASCLGILFSIVLLLRAVGRLLFIFLANPQTGIMIAPGPGGNPVRSISAIDAVSMMALLIMLATELLVLGFTLWLLFRTTRPSAETAEESA